MSIYGIKDAKVVNNTNIINTAEKFGISSYNVFKLDTNYLAFLNNLDTSLKQEVKNHLQPLQALYFNTKGDLESYYVNCYAGGFPNLKWNVNGLLNKFIPETQAPLDTVFTFQKLTGYIKNLNNTNYENLASYGADINVVVFWNIFMGRQSRRFINTIKQNCNLNSSSKINLIFVNTDDIYALH